MSKIDSHWQDSLNPQLLNRLTRPLQPGIIGNSISRGIIGRSDRLLNRFPLVSQQMQRWGKTNTQLSAAVTIVYAQPCLENEPVQIQTNDLPSVEPTDGSMPLIQRKVGDRANTQVSRSARSLPVATPQAISQELAVNREPIQAKLNNSAIDSSPLNLNTASIAGGDRDRIINTPPSSISAKSLPVVVPQAISQELTTVSEPIQAKLSNSAIDPSPPNFDTAYIAGGDSDRIPLTPTASTFEQIPIVAPLPIIKKLQPDVAPPLVRAKINSDRDKTPYKTPSSQIKQQIVTQALNIPNTSVERQTQGSDPNLVVPLVMVKTAIDSDPKLPLPLAQISPSQNPRSSSASTQLNQPAPIGNKSTTPVTYPRADTTETFTSSASIQPKVDLKAITRQVERKIMRRLVVESERRGKS